MMRFYATTVIESNSLSVAAEGRLCCADYNDQKSSFHCYQSHQDVVCSGTCGFDFSAQSYQSFWFRVLNWSGLAIFLNCPLIFKFLNSALSKCCGFSSLISSVVGGSMLFHLFNVHLYLHTFVIDCIVGPSLPSLGRVH